MVLFGNGAFAMATESVAVESAGIFGILLL
jgi:hypothetical protein